MHSQTSLSATHQLLLGGAIATVPAMIYYIGESIFFLPFLPFAFIGSWFLAKRNLQAPGYAVSKLRRSLSCAGIQAAVVGALVAAVLGSDKLGYYCLILLASSAMMLLRGYAPWTRVIACSALLWATCESFGGFHRLLHNQFAESIFASASGILDVMGIMHLLSLEGLHTVEIYLPATRLLFPFDNIWLAFAIAIFFNAYNRRPMLAAIGNLVMAFIIFWSLSTLMVIVIGLISNNSDFFGWAGGNVGYGLAGLKILLEAYLISCSDAGVAKITLRVPVTSSESNRGIFRIYAILTHWPAGLRPELDEKGGKIHAATTGHENLINGCHSPYPAPSEVQAAEDPFEKSLWPKVSFAIAGLSIVVWAMRFFLPSLFPF